MKKETIRLHIADMPKDVHFNAKMMAMTMRMSLKDYVIRALKKQIKTDQFSEWNINLSDQTTRND